ncbi:MAG: putative RNA methyltransferase [Eubacteriales bacterium]
MTDILDILTCPNCSAPLHRDGGSLKCPLGHTFDIAKSGYVNLLPPGKGKNAHTGDEHDMVKARVSFLSRGYYDRISQKAAELIARHLSPDSPVTLVDMGAGEGHHTLMCTAELIKSGFDVLSVGFDASKYASECGMKKSRAASLSPKNSFSSCNSSSSLYFIPANIFSLPIADSSADVCLSMFAPIPWDEVCRVLKKSADSMLLVVSSGKNHLIEMRSLIYDSVVTSDSLPAPDGRFSLVSSEELAYKARLTSPEDIKNLFMMTPFYYKTTEEGKNRLFSHGELTVTVDVNYTIFRLAK